MVETAERRQPLGNRGQIGSQSMKKIWILAADRVRARLFENQGVEGAVVEIASFVNPEGRLPTGSRGDSRPPRSFESVGAARHAIEPHTTPAEKVRERFARQLRDALEAGRVENRFDHLVLIAPPRFLGALRGVMGKNLSRHIIKEIEHGETELTPQQIAAHLHD